MPEFSKNQKLTLLAIVGLIVLGMSLKIAQTSRAHIQGDVVLTEPTGGDQSGEVIFHVAGCVNNPGVYTLPKGKRVMDAIKKAGGAKDGADVDCLNLAAMIEDGSRIYVPSESEPHNAGAPAAPAATAGYTVETKPASSNKLQSPQDGTVNINTADAGELQRLPGVGPSTAQSILE